MSAIKFSAVVENQFLLTYVPIEVRFKNRTRVIGYFEFFDDSAQLKKEFKYRFIPLQNAPDFRREKTKTKISNPEWSIIVDLNEVVGIYHVIG